MPTLQQTSDALGETLRHLSHSREEARDLVCTARLARESAQRTRQHSQELRRALWAQIHLARELRRHSP